MPPAPSDDPAALRATVEQLAAEVERQRQEARRWRELAEQRRVAHERLRGNPAVKVLVRAWATVRPLAERARHAAGSVTTAGQRVGGVLRRGPDALGARRRERRFEDAVASLPDPAADPRRVSVVILTRDGRQRLERLFDGLERHTLHDDLEVIVVDNASGPDTAEWLDRRPDVRVVRNRTNRSFTDGNRAGAAIATGEVLLFLNDDVEPVARGWLRRMLAALDRDVVAVGAQLVYPWDGLTSGRGRPLSVQHLGTWFEPVPGSVPVARNHGSRAEPDVTPRILDVPAATAACLLVDRAAYDASGGFDGRYEYGAEDVDLCWALRRRGGRIVVAADAVLYHHEGATRHRERSDLLEQRQRRNWDRFAAKWGPELTRAVAHDRIAGAGALTRRPFHVALTVTRDREDAGYGDYYTAHELGHALALLGWRVSYVERHRDRWYDLAGDVDVLVVLLDRFELPRVARPGLTTVAWIRNWTERWTATPWFEDYDLVLAASQRAADIVARSSAHRPVVFPIATNPDRFKEGLGPDARHGVVFTGNHWGADDRLSAVVGRIDELTIHGKGWDEVPAVAARWQGHLPYDALPDVYARALVVLDRAGAHTVEEATVNSRVFDASAGGALVVTDQAVGVRELFGDAVPTYEDPEELAGIVERLLDDPEGTHRRAQDVRAQVLASHTYAIRARTLQQLLRERTDRPGFALAISAPDRRVAPSWGDLHVAEALARELRVRGHDARTVTADAWEDRATRSFDVLVHLRGRSVAPRAEGQTHVVWNLSHPEELTPEECDAADLVLVASHTGFDRRVATWTATPVGVLLQATDHRRFAPRQPDPARAHDLLFVGNSRFVLREVIRDCLAAGLRPAIIGANWERFVDPGLIVATHVDNADLPTVYSSATVVLNDHWEGMRTHGFASNRLFDALACGAVVVSDPVPGLDDLFDDAVVTYRTPGELRAAVDRLLADPDERRERSERGRAAVLARHTFARRADEFLAMVTPVHDARRAAAFAHVDATT